MCLGIPGQIKSIEGNYAKVDLFGVQRDVSIVLIENPQINDYVIVHAGSAISILDEDEALKTIEIFKELSDIMNEEKKSSS
jgi:hydrogenase expression/formation protein HypC